MIEIISPEVEVIDISKVNKDLAASKIPEYVGRVCYNSYDKMTETSYETFNKKAASDSHRSIFEFNNLRLTLSIVGEESLVGLKSAIRENLFLKYNIIYNEKAKDETCYLVNIYGSSRSFIELLEKVAGGNVSSKFNLWLYAQIFYVLGERVPTILHNWSTIEELYKFYLATREMVTLPPVSCTDLTALTNIKGDKYKKILVKVVSDKGVHNELVRHRPASYMAESQRYVRYGIGENSKNPMRVCVSSYDKEDPFYCKHLSNSAEASLKSYMELLTNGYPAQQARAVLPVGTAMTYFIYADVEEWGHIFSLRTAKTALPMAQEIVKEIRDQMINKHLI